MKKIPLTQGKFALVDDEDYEWLMQWKWYVLKTRRIWYARRGKIYMHRMILEKYEKIKPDEYTDHKNRNGLDNRKKNIRSCTPAENVKNAFKYIEATSKYKGIYFNPKYKKWEARICVRGKIIYGGRYKNEIYAAKARDYFAIKYHKKFAILNFPHSRLLKNPLRSQASKHKGVGWSKSMNCWIAVIMKNYKSTVLGYFDSELEAAETYKKEKNANKRQSKTDKAGKAPVSPRRNPPDRKRQDD